MATWWL